MDFNFCRTMNKVRTGPGKPGKSLWQNSGKF